MGRWSEEMTQRGEVFAGIEGCKVFTRPLAGTGALQAMRSAEAQSETQHGVFQELGSTILV